MREFPVYINIALYFLLLVPGIPFQIGLLGLLFSLFLTTVLYPQKGFLSVCFFISGYMLVRWKSFESIVLAGFRTEVIIIFIVAYLVRKIIDHREMKAQKFEIPIDKILYATIAWFIICFIVNSNFNLLYFSLGIRENVLIWFLFPIAVDLFFKVDEGQNNYLKKVIVYFCLGTALVAVFNILNYYAILPLPMENFAGQTTGDIQYRNYLGTLIKRMNPILGSGPGAGGAYYFIVGAAAVYSASFIVKPTSFKIFLFIAGICCLFATYLTASLSAVLAFLLVSTVICIYATKGIRFVIIASIPIVVVGLALLRLSVLDADITDIGYSSLFEYFFTAFVGRIFDSLSDYEVSQFLFGVGLALRTGSLVLKDMMNDVVSIDISWLIILVKFGYLGAVLVIVLYGKYIINYFRLGERYLERHMVILTGILFFGVFSYIHSSPMIIRPFDFISVLSFSIIFYFTYGNQKLSAEEESELQTVYSGSHPPTGRPS